MTNKNHPVDKIFSKGLTDHKVTPSDEVKKKLFAAPGAIKPNVPWYIASKYLLLAAPALLIISAITYYTFFYENSVPSKLTIENSIANNAVSVNSNEIKNSSDLTEKNTNVQNNSDFTNNNVPEIKEEKENPNTENALISNTINKENSNNTYENKTTNNLPKTNIVITTRSGQPNTIAEVRSEVLTENSSVQTSSPETQTYISSPPSSSSAMSSVLITEDRSSLDFVKYIRPDLLSPTISNYSLQTKKESDYVLEGLWYGEFKLGTFVSNHKVTAKESEWQHTATAKQNLLVTSPGNDYQLNAVYQKNNLLFKAGISYASYGEKLESHVLLTNPQDQTQINFNNNAPYDTIIGGNYFLIDTLGGYMHYTYIQTSIINIKDSTWVWNTQNIAADMYDTTNYTAFDTMPENYAYNNFRFIEIPLSIGFVKPYGKFSIGLSATVSPGLFLAVLGSDMNLDYAPAIEPYKKSNLQKFILSAGANLEIGYQINEKLLLSVEPFYKRSLMKLYNTSNKINQSFYSYGVRIGIRKLL